MVRPQSGNSADAVTGVAALLALLLLATACGSEQEEQAPTVVTAAACQEPEQVPVQGGQHLIGDEQPPVPYNSTPPTSGWHASGTFDIAVHGPDDPLSEPQQVSVLEVGGVVVTHRDLPEDERQRLEQHVSDQYAGRVAVTPYEPLEPGTVAFTAWGVLQRCEGLDVDALDAFVAAHAEEQPAVPGAH